ncbi:hypothetical protein OH76DRAFT_1485919 [Lentinus brumalis]|uniref:Uncharacterized protein n=1 Tax=Lentinus brumalis TaxID=2498619 RepID=A0A371D0A0_9APHY|nr:hypothetical protein OH76DRAFT_1485919 [Polyporus brumalis]
MSSDLTFPLQLPFAPLGSLPHMGRRQLRDDEFEFIEQTQRSDDIRRILRGPHGAQAAASKRIEQLYRERFSGLLSGETEEEYNARRRKNPKAVRLHDETEDERKRILGVLKRGSDNFSRRKHARGNEDSENELQSTPVASATTNAYREFQSSQHPSKPKMHRDPDTPKSTAMRQWNHNLKNAYDSLPEADVAALQAQAEAKRAEQEGDLAKEARRAKYVQDLPALTKRAAHTWQKEGGWVGMIFAGGIDQHGEIAALHRPTGRDGQGRTFEERLAEEFGCTPQYIEVLFMKWLCEIFDAPVPLGGEGSNARSSLASADGTLDTAGVAPPELPTTQAPNRELSPDRSRATGQSQDRVVTSQGDDAAPHLSPAGAPSLQPVAINDSSLSAIHAAPPLSAQPDSGVSRPLTSLPARSPALADQATGGRGGQGPSPGQEQLRPHVDESSFGSDGSDEFPDIDKLNEQVPRRKTVLVPQLQVSRVTQTTSKKSSQGRPAKPRPSKSAKTQASKAVAKKIKNHKKKEITTGAHAKEAAASKLSSAGAAAAPSAVSPIVEEPLSSLPSATNLHKKARSAATTRSTEKKNAGNGAKSAKPKAAQEAAQPVETRTGRVVRRTARDQGVSPDMSAAKYAKSKHFNANTTAPAKRTREDENVLIDERSHKKRR